MAINTHYGKDIDGGWIIYRDSDNFFTVVLTNASGGAAIDTTSRVFSMEFYTPGGSTSKLTLTEADGDITNDDSGTLVFKLTQEDIAASLPRDRYLFVIKCAFSGDTKPVAQGYTNITRETNPGSTTTTVNLSGNLDGVQVNMAVTLAGGSGSGASAAEDVTFTPAGNVVATDVQAAIEELDSEKGGIDTINTWSQNNKFANGKLRVINPDGTFDYIFVSSAITAFRQIILPLLTGTDTMVLQAFAQALTNKTIVAASNTITDTSAAQGDLLKHNGTRFVRFAKGAAGTVPRVNSGGSDLEFVDINSVLGYIKSEGTSNLSATVIIGGQQLYSLELGANSNELRDLTLKALDDMHLVVGDVSGDPDSVLGQFSYNTGAQQLEITAQITDHYKLNLIMGGGDGVFQLKANAGGTSTGKNFEISGFDSVSIQGHVPNTRTIAGVDLQDNITTGELATALGVTGLQDLYIGAPAMWPRTTSGCAALAKTELATSIVNIQSLDFDQTTQEFAQFQIVLPRNWNNGTVTAKVYWTAAGGSAAETVQWGISGGAYSNDDALTVALGTAVTVDDALIATNDLHVSAATSAITLAGSPADADFLVFQISRNPGSDTLAADAKLLGVVITLTTDSGVAA